MTETLDLNAAGTATPDILPAPERGTAERERERHGQTPSRPHFAPEPRGPRLWQLVRRWQPAVSTAATLLLLFALIAGYAASRGVLPPGGDGGWRSQLAAVGTSAVQASPSPAAVACDADVDDVREVDRIRAITPSGPAPEYTPVRLADRETIEAVRAVYERFMVCGQPHGIFSSHEYASDRYVWIMGTDDPIAKYSLYAVDEVENSLFLDDGRVREEIQSATWWSTPPSADEARWLQPETFFVLSDGRVAGVSGEVTIPHEYEQSGTGLPQGIYWFVAFAQENGQWLFDESFGFGIGQDAWND